MRDWAGAIVLLSLSACAEEDAATSATIDRSLLDGSVPFAEIDASTYAGSTVDAAPLTPACAPFAACVESKPTLLYNVCVSGSPGGAVAQPACLVDPNGTMYLAPLTSGQLVTNAGWTQSTNASLSTADQSRCESARIALLVDAATPPRCAGGE